MFDHPFDVPVSTGYLPSSRLFQRISVPKAHWRTQLRLRLVKNELESLPQSFGGLTALKDGNSTGPAQYPGRQAWVSCVTGAGCWQLGAKTTFYDLNRL